MRYGTGPEVLRDINVKIDAGSFHFLTGPSGAGKSSLLKLIYMSERPIARTDLAVRKGCVEFAAPRVAGRCGGASA